MLSRKRWAVARRAMARPKADLPPAGALLALVDAAGRLAVRVTPGARREMVAIEQGTVCVKVRARPQDGAANDAVVRLVAQALGTAPSHVQLLRGATSREKLLRIGG